jgi:hypothetical protein
MRRIFPAFMAIMAAIGPARADDLKVPKSLPPLQTGLARATLDESGQVVLDLKYLQIVPVDVQYVVTVPVTVNKQVAVEVEVNGVKQVQTKTVPEVVLRTETRTRQDMVPKAWVSQKFNVKFSGMIVHDVRGNKVETVKLTELLAKETPVVVSKEAMIDPVLLTTLKETTLVVVIPPPEVLP